MKMMLILVFMAVYMIVLSAVLHLFVINEVMLGFTCGWTGILVFQELRRKLI